MKVENVGDVTERKARSVLCAGETMALVTPTTPERLRNALLFHVDAGGAESNVASHLVALGQRAVWFSRLGDDELGKRIVATLCDRGVDVSPVVFDPRAPTGVYFKDPGQGVLYYRAGSAASHLTVEDARKINFDDVRVLHLSGITAALSESAAEFVAEAMRIARQTDVLVSFDVNYRSRLWRPEEAAQPLRQLAEKADLVFVGRDEAHRLWGTETVESLRALLPDAPSLVIKDEAIGATEFCGANKFFERSEEIHVVEVVGAGDAFAGGYLASLLGGATASERLRAGHQRAALTLQTTTDFIDPTGADL